MFPFNVTVRSSQEMESFGAEISEYLVKTHHDSILLLEGELGAGKTAFAKGLGKGLGISENINSPTFNLLNEYTGKTGRLFHYDLYRIHHPEEVLEAGFTENWSEKSDLPSVHAVEWWKKAGNYIPDAFPRFLIRIAFSLDNEEYRILQGSEYES